MNAATTTEYIFLVLASGLIGSYAGIYFSRKSKVKQSVWKVLKDYSVCALLGILFGFYRYYEGIEAGKEVLRTTLISSSFFVSLASKIGAMELRFLMQMYIKSRISSWAKGANNDDNEFNSTESEPDN